MDYKGHTAATEKIKLFFVGYFRKPDRLPRALLLGDVCRIPPFRPALRSTVTYMPVVDLL
jgi:hypothetical protein